MDSRTAASMYAWSRVAVGVALLAAPSGATAVWFGDRGRSDATRTAARALGGREIALGVGTLRALGAGHTGEARRWLSAGIAGDALDAAVTARSTGRVANRAAVTAMAVTGAVAGSIIRSRLY